MKRSIKGIEEEIVHLILVAELCFDICEATETVPGRGADFLPFYYNLNYTKGLINLHSLLLSKEERELSLQNYLTEFKKASPGIDISCLEQEISKIRLPFEEAFPVKFPLRHKIAAHFDEMFDHTDFTNGYILPATVPTLVALCKNLKQVFLKFTGWASHDYPFSKVLEQSVSIISSLGGEKR